MRLRPGRPHTKGLPSYVQQEFYDYLECSILSTLGQVTIAVWIARMTARPRNFSLDERLPYEADVDSDMYWVPTNQCLDPTCTSPTSETVQAVTLCSLSLR